MAGFWKGLGQRFGLAFEPAKEAAKPTPQPLPSNTQPPDAAPLAKVAVGETGITGTSNYVGQLRTEQNTSLWHVQAYGRAGNIQWGEWEKLARTNPFVSMALEFVKAPIRDAKVSVEPADDSDEAQKQADFIQWCLEDCGEPKFPEFLNQATNMLVPGFSLFEPVFKEVESEFLPGGKGFGLKKLAERLPSSLHPNAWIENEDGTDLAVIRQMGPRNGRTVTVELPADRTLLFTWQRNGNNYAGFSAFRSVWYLCKIQEELMRLVGVSYQREAAGVPIAVAANSSDILDADQRQAMQEFLANLVYHENASAVMPPGWKIDWVFSPGANKGHVIEAWQDLGNAVLQQLQAQQLILGTNGASGSRSAGETHYQASESFVKGVVAVIESVLNGSGDRPYTGLVKKLIDANWGPQKAYPQIKLTLKRQQLAALDRLQAISLGKAAGALHITLEDENEIREQLGLAPLEQEEYDELKQAEEDAKQEQLDAVSSGMAGGVNPKGDGKSASNDATSKKAKPPTKAHRFADASGVYVPRRALRASEQCLDLARMDSFLSSQRETFEAKIKPVVLHMLSMASPQIRLAMADGDPSDVADVKFDTQMLTSVVKQFIRRCKREGAAQVAMELKKSKVHHATRLAVDDENDADVDMLTKSTVRRITNRLASDLESNAIDVVRTNGSEEEVVTRTISKQLDSSAFKTDAGTFIAKSMNMGREEAARELGAATVELSAALDANTCDYCDSMDGETAEAGSPEHEAMTPPLRECDGRDNCRCVLIYTPAESSSGDTNSEGDDNED